MSNMDCPFEVGNRESLTIQADIEGKLFDVYYPIFTNHGYTGNGYSWEGHIVQILEQTDPDLISRITFDPEAGSFFAIAKDYEALTRFQDALCPIFIDLDMLGKYLDSADRTRIDD